MKRLPAETGSFPPAAGARRKIFGLRLCCRGFKSTRKDMKKKDPATVNNLCEQPQRMNMRTVKADTGPFNGGPIAVLTKVLHFSG